MARSLSVRQLAHAPTESQLQAQIVEGLRMAGYLVLECGRYVRQVKCPCGCNRWFTPHSGYGNTPGTPDLLVGHRNWPVAIWKAIELKTPAYSTILGTVRAGTLSKEQQELANAGRIAVCRSLEEVLAVVKA